MKMWILLHILAYFFNINVILGNLLETFEIFANHLFCQRSGCAGCIKKLPKIELTKNQMKFSNKRSNHKTM